MNKSTITKSAAVTLTTLCAIGAVSPAQAVTPMSAAKPTITINVCRETDDALTLMVQARKTRKLKAHAEDEHGRGILDVTAPSPTGRPIRLTAITTIPLGFIDGGLTVEARAKNGKQVASKTVTVSDPSTVEPCP